MADNTASVNPLDFIKYLKYAPLIIQIVGAVQALRGPGNGAAKKQEALRALAAALAVTEGISEKDLVVDERFLSLGGRLIDLGVMLMQAQPEIEAIAADIRALKPKPAA